MKAIQLYRYGRTPQLVTLDLPAVTPGTHLIKMSYAPINPSDLNFYTGTYGIRKQLPATMGFEGSGLVQDSTDKSLIGRTVSVMSPHAFGTYATHLLAPDENLLFWPEGTHPKDVCSMFINPFTVIAMRNRVYQLGMSKVLLSAAGSALGRMIVRNFVRNGLTVMGTVRNSNIIDDLKKTGFHQIYQQPLSEADRTELGLDSQPVCFLDCIGGNFAGEVFNSLPPKSVMVNYGRLAKEPLGNIDLGQLYYREKKIEGFWLKTYMGYASAEQKAAMAREVLMHKNEFATRIRLTIPIKEFQRAMHQSIKDTSHGKVVINCADY